MPHARYRLLGALAIALLGAPALADLPPEGACPQIAPPPPPGASPEVDVVGIRLREGLTLELSSLPALQALFPPEVWTHREAFFFEGMQLELGPCYRRYPVPVFYAAATLRHWEEVQLDRKGNLRGHRAGLPFPLDRIDPTAPDAGVRWAWNFEHRYRGAGPVGSFRLLDLPSRIGSPETYLGSFFLVQTRRRADLVEGDYAVPEADGYQWVAGGRFEEPFNVRHLAWRQMRPEKVMTRYRESDRTYVYVPEMRKARRAATTWVDGLYMPRYTVGGTMAAGGGVPYGQGDRIESIHPTSSWSAAITENMRRGFIGLALRPNAYDWKFLGERPVLAPLNGSRSGYPDAPNRNFGPSGLSVADDRWDLRHAVVIEGRSRVSDQDVTQVTLYIDYQTQQLLYYVSRREDGLLLDVGILVHRFSGDIPDYPRWPGGKKALVFDPVAATFFSPTEGGTGWRRESYDLRSVPAEPGEVRRMTSVAELDRGR